MAAVVETAPSHDRELVLCRIIDAPREKVYRCWTEPELLKQWFAPKPWITSRRFLAASSLVVSARTVPLMPSLMEPVAENQVIGGS